MRSAMLALFLTMSMLACAQPAPPGGSTPAVEATGEVSATTTSSRSASSQAGEIAVQVVAQGLDHPWGMAFLPDGRLLVTERDSGKLLALKNDGTRQEIAGVPEVVARGQGGLMDVAAHPNFARTGLVYLAYAAPGRGRESSTTLGRGKLVEGRLEDFQVLFAQDAMTGGTHFGNRIVFSPDGHLFLATGERFSFTPAQDLARTLGKVLRLKDDGSVPTDNPCAFRQIPLGCRPRPMPALVPTRFRFRLEAVGSRRQAATNL